MKMMNETRDLFDTSRQVPSPIAETQGGACVQQSTTALLRRDTNHTNEK